MSREARVVRGSVGALIATLFAAASHAAAGGAVTAVAVVATSLLALPLCVALAGRVGSLWRLAIGVGVSQFVYHWSFAGLGVASGSPSGGGLAESPHAAHLAQMQAFAPELAVAGAADALMWISHAVSAILTITLMHRGEHAMIALRSLLSRAIPHAFTRIPAPHFELPVVKQFESPVALRDLLRARQVCSNRGPPALILSPHS